MEIKIFFILTWYSTRFFNSSNHDFSTFLLIWTNFQKSKKSQKKLKFPEIKYEFLNIFRIPKKNFKKRNKHNEFSYFLLNQTDFCEKNNERYKIFEKISENVKMVGISGGKTKISEKMDFCQIFGTVLIDWTLALWCGRSIGDKGW